MTTSPALSTKAYPLMMHLSLSNKANCSTTDNSSYNATTQTSSIDVRMRLDKCFTKHGAY